MRTEEHLIRAAVGKRRPDDESGASDRLPPSPERLGDAPSGGGQGLPPFPSKDWGKVLFPTGGERTRRIASTRQGHPAFFISLTPRQNGVLETVVYRAATRKKAVQSFLFTVIRLTTRS